MPLEIFVALRYLKARRNGVFTLLTTLIAVGGITLGVASLIITLSVMSGFHRDIRDKILGLQPHILIVKENGEPFTEHEDIARKLLNNPGVIAAAPFVYGQAIVRSKSNTIGTVVKGIDWGKETGLVNIAHMIVGQKSNVETQNLASLQGLNSNEALLGNELARNLRVTTGDDVVLMFPSQLSAIPKMSKFKVKAIFHSGMYEYDANLCYITLNDAQKLFGLPSGSVTGLGVKLTDWEASTVMEKYFQQQLKYPFWARSWQRMNGNLFAALKLEKIMMFIILGLIILVASFNIISNLLLLSVEKASEIGIMSAMGIPKLRIGMVFFWEGIVIGGSGIIMGFIAGIGVALSLAKYQFIKLPADVYYIDHLPVRIIPADIISVALVAMIITIVAAIYPAWQAAKLNPLDAIRYG